MNKTIPPHVAQRLRFALKAPADVRHRITENINIYGEGDHSASARESQQLRAERSIFTIYLIQRGARLHGLETCVTDAINHQFPESPDERARRRHLRHHSPRQEQGGRPRVPNPLSQAERSRRHRAKLSEMVRFATLELLDRQFTNEGREDMAHELSEKARLHYASLVQQLEVSSKDKATEQRLLIEIPEVADAFQAIGIWPSTSKEVKS